MKYKHPEKCLWAKSTTEDHFYTSCGWITNEKEEKEGKDICGHCSREIMFVPICTYGPPLLEYMDQT